MMKKFLTVLVLGLAVFAVSCSKDEEVIDVSVTFGANALTAVATAPKTSGIVIKSGAVDGKPTIEIVDSAANSTTPAQFAEILQTALRSAILSGDDANNYDKATSTVTTTSVGSGATTGTATAAANGAFVAGDTLSVKVTLKANGTNNTKDLVIDVTFADVQ